jgi:hypothetical protein
MDRRSPAGGHAIAATLVAAIVSVSALSRVTSASASSGGTIRSALNRVRAEAGVAPLELSPELTRRARRLSHAMAQRGSLLPAPGSLPEVDGPIAGFTKVAPSGPSLARRLLGRPAARQTIQGSVWERIGVGAAGDGTGRRWFTILLATGDGTTPDPPLPPDPDGIKIPSSVSTDCSRDVTREINDWIGSVPDHSTLVFARGACYRIDGSIRVEDRFGLTFEGNGATFAAGTDGDYARRHFWFFGGGDLVIRNLTVRGANPNGGAREDAVNLDREAQHAFALQGVQGALLERVQAYDTYGGFVYLSSDIRPGGGAWSRDVTVRHSRFERNGWQGIAVSAAENVLIQDNYVGGVGMVTFDLEPDVNDWGARNVRIVGNTTGPGLLGWLANAGHGSNVSNIHVADNVMIGPTGVPIINVITPAGEHREGYVIENNRFIVNGNGWRSGMEFTGVTDLVIRNNQVTHPAWAHISAVGLIGSREVQVRENAFTGAGRVVEADASSEYVEAGNTT